MTAVKKYALLSLCGLTLFCARAQMPATNYDESQVPAYTLPDPLTTIAGKKVTDAETWTSERRPELLSLFESEVYGKAPGRPEGLHFEVLSEDRYTLGNMATRREIAVYFTESDAHFMTILLYIPNKRTDQHMSQMCQAKHTDTDDTDLDNHTIQIAFRNALSLQVIQNDYAKHQTAKQISCCIQFLRRLPDRLHSVHPLRSSSCGVLLFYLP